MSTKKNANGYWFRFADGHELWARGLSAQERRVEEQAHGKLVAKRPA